MVNPEGLRDSLICGSMAYAMGKNKKVQEIQKEEDCVDEETDKKKGYIFIPLYQRILNAILFLMSKKLRWTEEELKKAIKESTSRRQVIRRLGLVINGGSHRSVKKHIELYGIDTSHFKGNGWSRDLGGAGIYRIPIKNILIKDSTYQTNKLKHRLFGEGIMEQKCEFCSWDEKSEDGRVPVELDHINGDSKDHRLENLRILCPNCHSLQLTHRGKNRKDRWRED